MVDQENTNVVEFMEWVKENKYGIELKPTAEHFPTSYKCWTYYDVVAKTFKIPTRNNAS